MAIFKSKPRVVTDLLQQNMIDSLRMRCAGNPLACAQTVSQDILWGRRHACMVVFNGAGGLTAVPNDFSGGPKCYDFHAVALVEDEVIDLLHTDKLYSIKDWVKRMKRLTPNLQINFQMSSPILQQMILNKLI